MAWLPGGDVRRGRHEDNPFAARSRAALVPAKDAIAGSRGRNSWGMVWCKPALMGDWEILGVQPDGE